MTKRICGFQFCCSICTCKMKFKGTVPWHFWFQVFSWIVSPKPLNRVSHLGPFFKNLRKYSQIKVHRWCCCCWWQIYHQCCWYRGQYDTSVWLTTVANLQGGVCKCFLNPQILGYVSPKISNPQISFYWTAIANPQILRWAVRKLQILRFFIIRQREWNILFFSLPL